MITIIKQELSHDSIARLNCALPITNIRAVARRLSLTETGLVTHTHTRTHTHTHTHTQTHTDRQTDRHTHTLKALTLNVYVGYTELTCIPDLGLNADIEGQVVGPRSLVCGVRCHGMKVNPTLYLWSKSE